MGWLLTFGAIGGVVEHMLAALKHAVEHRELPAILIAFCGVCFVIRHYGSTTLSDIGKLLSLVSKVFSFIAAIASKSSKQLSCIFERSEETSAIQSSSEEFGLAKLQRMQRHQKLLPIVGLSLVAGSLLITVYSVVDTKTAVQPIERLRPPEIVKFSDRYEKLYDGHSAIGGPGRPMASSLAQFSDQPLVPPIRFLNSPWRAE